MDRSMGNEWSSILGIRTKKSSVVRSHRIDRRGSPGLVRGRIEPDYQGQSVRRKDG